MIVTHMVMFSFFINMSGTSTLDYFGGAAVKSGIGTGIQRGVNG